jgi:hypothetical protein
MDRARNLLALSLVILLVAACPASAQRPEGAARPYDQARLYERLSEPGGYFGSDNLVSNELSYQHVMPKLAQMNLTGGAYLGVGPDQNFTYIAQIKPRVAFMIDIRRDNMLQHLLFKSVFIMARNRVEYLALLFGRPAPANLKQWNDRSLRELVDYVDRTPSSPRLAARTWAEIRERLSRFGYQLSERDYNTIHEIYQAFYQSGLEVRYTIRDRPSNRFFPAYRDLLLETDLDGRQRNYFSSEADFQVIKQMQERNQIIPVTGDLSGKHAVRAIGQYLNQIGERVSAFYTSNVEFYLVRQGSFEQFVENLKALPIDGRSVIIRSYFNYAYQAYQHPQTIENYFSVQLLQTIDSLVKDHNAGGYESYYDLVTRRSIDLR